MRPQPPEAEGSSRLVGLALPVVRAFKKWIALEFGVHMGRQIKVGELQQLDGLHQLRRHHQGLRLAEL